MNNLLLTSAEYYEANVTTASDYYPFGWQMPNRKLSTQGYSYGFNGQIQDSEWMGGQSVSFEYRILDPRLGRFLSVDPLAPNYPWYTPYQFAGNRPVWARDLEGLEEDPSASGTTQTSDGSGKNVPRTMQDIKVSGDGSDVQNSDLATPQDDGSFLGGALPTAGVSADPIDPADKYKISTGNLGADIGIGMSPVGIGIDAYNGFVDLYHGNYWSAGFNFLLMVPGTDILKGLSGGKSIMYNGWKKGVDMGGIGNSYSKIPNIKGINQGGKSVYLVGGDGLADLTSDQVRYLEKLADKLKDANANGSYTKISNCPYTASQSIRAVNGEIVNEAKDRLSGATHTLFVTSGILRQEEAVAGLFGFRKLFSFRKFGGNMVGNNMSGFEKAFKKMNEGDVWAISVLKSRIKKGDHIFAVHKKFDKIWAIESQIPHKYPIISLFRDYSKAQKVTGLNFHLLDATKK